MADTTVLHAPYKKHHWNVFGPTFYQLHLLFDKHAGERLNLVDLLAERVQSHGGISVGDARHAAELTTIPRPPDGSESVADMLDLAAPRHEQRPRARRAAGRRPLRCPWGPQYAADSGRRAAVREPSRQAERS
jgi:starvation-inducible DNA-binding protein